MSLIEILRPEELLVLVDTIARTLRGKELGLPVTLNGQTKSDGGQDGAHNDGECEEDEALDLFSCRLCKCLLQEPATLECGHTFCKRCVDGDAVKYCISCKQKPSKGDRRVNVVLSGLLDKLFETESKARKMWIEGEVLPLTQKPGCSSQVNARTVQPSTHFRFF
uniref:RING-type domain-containing protein n=1 Tax=Xiphophorus couchianus TaxID=32473 RepID=A0A3B5MMI2_9TELE